MNRPFDLADLRDVLRRCGGDDDAAELDESALDLPYDEVGYDSLALLALATELGELVGYRLPEDALDRMATPRATLGYVNELLARVS